MHLAERIRFITHHRTEADRDADLTYALQLEDYDTEEIIFESNHEAFGPMAVGFVRGLDYARRACGLPECQVDHVAVIDDLQNQVVIDAWTDDAT